MKKNIISCNPFYILICFFLFTPLISQNTDINLLKKINLSRNHSLDPSFQFITNSAPFICAGIPLTMLTTGLITKDSLTTSNALIIGTAIITSGIISISFKYAINRPRPFVTYSYIDKKAKAGPYSFPSGHTSEAFALSTSLSLAYPKWYIIAPAYLWASSVAYSRMFLGVHYPSDVFAGAIIGSGAAFLCFKLNKVFILNKKTRPITQK